MQEKELILRKNRELGAVLDVSRVLTQSFDLEKNLTSVMNILGSSLDMQRGCVFLLDPVTKDLRIVAAHGLTGEEIRRGKYKIGEGIVGRVMESGQPMFVPDIGSEPRFLNRTGSRPEKKGVSFLTIPIGLKGEMFGVISVDRIYAEEHGGVDDDLRVLAIVASLIAQFVKLWENFKRAEDEKEALRSQLKDRYSIPNLVGESERFQAVLKTVLKVAATDATVLLLGESGTGKELIARTVHFESRRAKGPFVAVNCAALPENLLEVELFGSEKGAFTGATKRTGRFEMAEGGTIFLDEVAELPLSLQPKLLRVLQERTFEPLGSSKTVRAEVRVIAATNRNLEAEVRAGNFREDLYWRLNVVPIVLPPLRERKKDIPLLIGYYLKKFSQIYRKSLKVSDDAMEALSAYQWPGNVRELANALERLAIMSEGGVISKSDLPFALLRETGGAALSPTVSGEEGHGLMGEVETLERARIIKALKENDMVQHKAAGALGITARQFGYRLKKYGIDVSKLS